MCTKLSVAHRNWLLCGFCSIPLILGAISLFLGVWLCVVVTHNANLPPENQLNFEKVNTWTDFAVVHHVQSTSDTDHSGGFGSLLHLDNEPSFTKTPVDNLCFYLMTLSFVLILGGCGRLITTSFFCVHFCHKRLTNQLFWSWIGLSTLVVTIEFLVTYDILQTLSHNDVAPPYNRDFFFGNDIHFGFYWLCHTFRSFIWIDLCLSGLTQSVVWIGFQISSIYKDRGQKNLLSTMDNQDITVAESI